VDPVGLVNMTEHVQPGPNTTGIKNKKCGPV
jgi:hypothetical protein